MYLLFNPWLKRFGCANTFEDSGGEAGSALLRPRKTKATRQRRRTGLCTEIIAYERKDQHTLVTEKDVGWRSNMQTEKSWKPQARAQSDANSMDVVAWHRMASHRQTYVPLSAGRVPSVSFAQFQFDVIAPAVICSLMVIVPIYFWSEDYSPSSLSPLFPLDAPLRSLFLEYRRR